ncbi:DUF7322 domain-containing protein [Halorussus pelagicus]|uniref:DUF7322 domain-containing protein n=1 Tax=Halorussus pelagicus TaxID=2505977 RepID=UPI000FFC2CCF|nr:hypothetical protein [Halorussus pelagicus]
MDDAESFDAVDAHFEAVSLGDVPDDTLGESAIHLSLSPAIVQLMFLGPPSPEDEQSDREFRKGLDGSSPETLKTFALLAVLLQAALLSFSLGAMLLGFRGQLLVGGALTVGGLVGFGVAAVIYRRWKRRNDP